MRIRWLIKMKNETQNNIAANYVPIEKYDSIKDSATSCAKDELIENLLKTAVDHDLCNDETPISEIQTETLNTWVGMHSHQNACNNLEDKTSILLANFYPDAIGKIATSEVYLFASLVFDLSKLGFKVTIGFVKGLPTSKLEVWIICKEKDYSILESATKIINDYIVQNRKDVNCVFVGENQLISNKTPKFVMQFGEYKMK